MQRGGDDESNSESDKAEEFNVLVASDARSEIISDLFVEDDNASAEDHDGEADKECAK